MADWPLYDGQGCDTNGVTSVASTGAAVTSGGSAHTKGSWAELTASTLRAVTGLILNFGRGHTTTADFLVDIGIGAAGSEQVLAPNLISSNATNLMGPGQLILPVGVPAGARISARCQSTAANATCRIQVLTLYGSWLGASPLSRVTAYGANTADSGGAEVDPGGTANTKGSWTQITAATTNPMRAMILGIGNQNNASRGTAFDWLVDVAIGGSGSETVVLADWKMGGNAADDIMWPRYVGPIPCNIPAGTRLAARAQCNQIDSDRTFDVAVYGLD